MVKLGTEEAECCKKVVNGRRVADAIRFLVKAKCLHESLLMPVLTYGRETMKWMEKERSRIRAVHMDNLRDLLGIRRMDKVPNAWIMEL